MLTLSQDDKHYSMDYQDYLKGNGKWVEDNRTGLIGPNDNIFLNKVIITKGCLLEPLSMVDRSTLQPSELHGVWLGYCEATGFDKEIFIESKLEFNSLEHTMNVSTWRHVPIYNEDNQSISINAYIYKQPFTIIKADDKNLTLAFFARNRVPDEESDERIDVAQKQLIFFNIRELSAAEKNNIKTYNSDYEARLDMIRLAKDYFGNYYKSTNLVELEQKIKDRTSL